MGKSEDKIQKIGFFFLLLFSSRSDVEGRKKSSIARKHWGRADCKTKRYLKVLDVDCVNWMAIDH
jgi:hypothetical protein